MCVCVCVCVCVIHRQICCVLSELISVARRARSRSWDQNQVDSNANRRFYHSATRKPAPAPAP